MSELVLVSAALVFVAAQGAAIFVTAFLALRAMRVTSRRARLPAIAASYGAWSLATMTGYAVLGGEGGLMDGFGLVLTLCFTALISALVYGLAWLFVSPPAQETSRG